jgi:diguanylate cyclase (GGDEF)-like protein
VVSFGLALVPTGSIGADEVRPIRFEKSTIEDGLSQNSVLAIHQDSTGFMWFGTEEGLDRFDGYDFVNYRHEPSDPSSISCSYVWAIAEDLRGDLWLATDGGGLSRWDRDRDSFESFRAGEDPSLGPSSDHIRSLVVGPSGLLWLATRDAGLNSFDPATGAFVHYRHDGERPSSIGDDRLFTIWIDGAGSVWVGTDRGLDRLNPETGEFTHYRHDPRDPASLSDDRIRTVVEDRLGALWVGTRDGGLNRLDPTTGDVRRYRHRPGDPGSLGHDRVRAILEDDSGRLWIGTVAGLGLYVPEEDRFVHYVHDPADPGSLSKDDVFSLYQDRGGVIWVGTQLGGVNRWNPTTFSFGHRRASAAAPGGLSHSNVMAFAEDRDGRHWIGTFGGGINIWERARGRFVQLRSDPRRSGALSSDLVMVLLRDRTGVMWVGTMDGGLDRFDPDDRSFTHHRHDPDDPRSLGSDGVMSLLEDSAGDLWVGTFGGGLNLLDRATWTFTRHVNDPTDGTSLSSDRVTCIAEDPSGGLWIGTDAGGLNFFDPRTRSFRRFVRDEAHPASLSSDTVFSLSIEPSGRVWIGTRGGGLNTLAELPPTGADPQFEVFSTRDGLPNDTIYGILPDGDDSLWVSTNRGLARMDRETGTFRAYRASHGLQADEFNFGAHHRSATGELFFGGINGFNAFHPDDIETNTAVPAVVLTAFLKLNKPVPVDGNVSQLDAIDLGFADDVVTFEFAALDFTAPRENRYAYMLEGFDQDWIDLDAVRRVTFTDLDGGDYRLRVKGSNNEGVWNEVGLDLPIRVAPPPWETWWAYLLYALGVGSVGFGLWWVQQRKLKREEEYSGRLELEVAERTQELEDRACELEDLNRKLVDASLTDSLTGLRNRRFLFEHVAKDIALVRRRYQEYARGGDSPSRVCDLAFLMVDLDHFKPINDSFGHAAGDRVLVDVRNLLLDACRDSDIVIRWGGDEFLVVGRDSEPSKAEILAERIRRSIEDHVFKLGDNRVARTTCSVGFACFPFVRRDPDALPWEQTLALADAALYSAKNTSRNAWVGYLSTPLSAQRRADIVRVVREEPNRARFEGLLEIRASIPPEKWVIKS